MSTEKRLHPNSWLTTRMNIKSIHDSKLKHSLLFHFYLYTPPRHIQYTSKTPSNNSQQTQF